MIRTFCTTIRDPDAEAKLSRMAELFAAARHWAFRELHVRRTPLRDVKRQAIARFGISARHFNGIRYELDQHVAAERGLVEHRRSQLRDAIERTEERIGALGRRYAKAMAEQRLRRAASAKFQQVGKKQRLDVLRGRLASLEARSAASEVPRICFGGRTLLREGDVWGWRARRASRILLVGAACESQGNQSVRWDGQTLSLRNPDALGGGWIALTGVTFRQQEVAEVLARSRDKAARSALTRLLYRDEGGVWQLRLTAQCSEADIVTSVENGVIGVDLNVDHLAVTVVDRSGNPVGRLSLPFPVAGTDQHVAADMLGRACKALAELALQHGAAVACEQLNFARKKAGLREYGTAHARRLSGFAYARFFQTLSSRCARMGVRLVQVDPAFTSVIGRMKYRVGHAMSVHHAAALVIGRAAMGYGERLVDTSGVCLDAPARMRPRTDRRRWRGVRRLTGEAGRQALAARTRGSGIGTNQSGVGAAQAGPASTRHVTTDGVSLAGPVSSRGRRCPGGNVAPVTGDTG